jgi:IMP cyclohydrolase
MNQPVLSDDAIKQLMDALQELKPLLNGESGSYLGIYNPAANKICEIMGWKTEEAIKQCKNCKDFELCKVANKVKEDDYCSDWKQK